jgi:hypothetical protein
MKRKRYTYIPKDEIAEVRTFNDVSFESDDLLDGAYVKGRKKFARGGMPSKRPMSLEEQAAESVGYDIWYSMDAVNQKELVEELVSTGMISPMFANGGMMANGGEIKVGDIVELENGMKAEVVRFSVKDKYNWVVVKTLKQYGGDTMTIPKDNLEKLAEGGMMANGGMMDYNSMTKYQVEKEYKKLTEKRDLLKKKYGTFESDEVVENEKEIDKIITLLYGENFSGVGQKFKYADGGMVLSNDEIIKDIDFEDNTDRRLGRYDFSFSTYDKEGAEILDYDGYIIESSASSRMNDEIEWGQNIPEDWETAEKILIDAFSNWKYKKYADGGMTGSTYSVKYSMKETPEIVKEKVFSDKDSAELFYETISEDEDLVVMDLQEVKVAPAPKKSLFATAKPAPATAASKKKRERVEVDGIADEIARYDELKATINNAKAEQEVIGGMLKEIGREKFLDLYEQRGVRPANFDLADGSENILLEILDKYLKVEPEKAELLRQFDGLLEEKTSYEFDSELLEKEVSEGMTIGDVVSMLIQDSKLIPDGDKANLIKAKMTMRVPKGTIDRLMDYDNPREVFSLISPILALK